MPTISPIRRTIDPVSSQPGPESEETLAAGRALQPPQPPPHPLTPLLSIFWPQAIENKYFSRFNIAQTAENKQLIFRIHPKHFLGGSTRGNAPRSVQTGAQSGRCLNAPHSPAEPEPRTLVLPCLAAAGNLPLRSLSVVSPRRTSALGSIRCPAVGALRFPLPCSGWQLRAPATTCTFAPESDPLYPPRAIASFASSLPARFVRSMHPTGCWSRSDRSRDRTARPP